MTREQYEAVAKAVADFEEKRQRPNTLAFRDAKHALKWAINEAMIDRMEAIEVNGYAYRLDASYQGITRLRLVKF